MTKPILRKGRPPASALRTLVVVNPADARQDYYLPHDTADELVRTTRLGKVHVYSNEWTVYDPQREFIHLRVG
jgi:hypothetical protein